MSMFKSVEGEYKYRAAYAATLKLWPVPTQSLEVSTGFGPTHLIVAGPAAGEPLVLLHGFYASATEWYANIETLAAKYRVYALDIMGQPGLSCLGERPLQTKDELVQWLLDLLEQLNLEKVSLTGHSYGGWLALLFASRFPERVKQLILVSPGGFSSMNWQFFARGLLCALFPYKGMINKLMLGWIVAKENKSLLFDHLFGQQFRVGLKFFKPARGPLVSALSQAELQRLDMPVLLMFGEEDIIYWKVSQGIANARQGIKQLELAIIPQAGHLLNVEQPALVNAHLRGFLGLKDNSQQVSRS